MIRLLRLVVAALLLGASPGALSAQSLSDSASDVDRLRWMAGCWELRTPTRVTHEQWMSPLGGLMLGMSRTVVRDTAREYESLRIERRNEVTSYVAQPSGQALTAFTATLISDTMVVFANPAHDFPQRIIYRPVGTDSLVARIEGGEGAKLRGMNFPMRRVVCGGSPPAR